MIEKTIKPDKEIPEVSESENNGSDDLKSLIEKNIRWSQANYEMNKKINRRLTWMAVGSYIRLALFLTPIILGIIYLPPLIEKFLNQYAGILGTGFNPTGAGQLNDVMSQFSGEQIGQILKLLGQ